MDVNQISILLGLLSFIAIAIGAAALVAALTGRAERARPLFDLLLPVAFAVALVSTLGSLYYSGIVHFRPCRLCWWQRIMMYPLVPFLGIASLRRDRLAALYALPLALGGLGYSIYHTQLRWFPEQGSSCEAEAACTSVWVNTFGFISIPFMAGAGFLAITGLLALHLRLARAAAHSAPSTTNSASSNPASSNPASPNDSEQPALELHS